MSGGELKRVKGQEKNLFGRWATDLSGDMGKLGQQEFTLQTQYFHNNFTSILSWQVFISSHLDPQTTSVYYLPFTI